jgi:hypothetical protein
VISFAGAQIAAIAMIPKIADEAPPARTLIPGRGRVSTCWSIACPGHSPPSRPGLAAEQLQKLRAWLRARTRLQRWAFALLILLVLIGVRIFSQVGGWKQGVFVTLALLKGEYVDPVNLLLADITGMEEVSGWLIGGTLFYSLVGTLLTSALVAVILERLLRGRLGLDRIRLLRRGPAPVLLVGGTSLAQRIAQRLRRHQQLVVRVESGGQRWLPGQGNRSIRTTGGGAPGA